MKQQSSKTLKVGVFGKNLSLFGNRLFTVFVDNASMKPYIAFKETNSSLATLENYDMIFKKREQKLIEHFHSDGGSEFLGVFQKYLKQEQITVTTSNPYQPAENHRAEECIGYFKTSISENLAQSGLPDLFSENAAAFAAQQKRNLIDPELEPSPGFNFGELCVYRAGPTASSRGKLGLFLHLCEDSLPSLQKNSYLLLDFISLRSGILRFIRTDRIVSTDVDPNSTRTVVENIFECLSFDKKKKKKRR